MIVRSSQYNYKGQIRLSIYDSIFIEDALNTATVDDLNSVKEAFDQEMRLGAQKVLQKIGMPFVFSETNLSTVKFYSKIGILYEYIRKGTGNSLWKVEQYIFPDSRNNRDIRLTLSYDISEKEKYKPILNDVLKSLKF